MGTWPNGYLAQRLKQIFYFFYQLHGQVIGWITEWGIQPIGFFDNGLLVWKKVEGSFTVIGTYPAGTNPSKRKIFIGDLYYSVVDGPPAKTIPIDYFFLERSAIGEDIGSQGFAIIGDIELIKNSMFFKAKGHLPILGSE